MRSVLVLSAEQAFEIEALDSGASALLLRLCALPARDAARARARTFVEAARARSRRPKIFVQVAPLRSGEIDDDLAALVVAGVDGVFLEACGGREDVQQLSVRLSVREAEAGLRAGAVGIVALASQTPASVFKLDGYKGASRRLVALAMDEIGLPGGAQARATARALMVLGAAAAGVPAIDSALSRRGDEPAAALAAAREDGFSGSMGFSAEEIAAIEACFDVR
jgi:citrate lyase subunit beta / citryl-CoA lyase